MADFGPIVGDLATSYAMIVSSGRMIGDVIPDVVMEEMHRDELISTLHPVETGTPITDHAFLMPQTVEMRCGWSDASEAGAPGYVIVVYQQLLALQQSRQPFDVITGKRQYSNMLMRSLMVKTDVESEAALMVVARLQQIIIVDVQTSGGTSPNTNGSSGVGNVSSDLSAQNASAAGLNVDQNGNVSFPNGVATGGNYQLLGGVPTIGQSSSNIFFPGQSGAPPTFASISGSLSSPGL